MGLHLRFGLIAALLVVVAAVVLLLRSEPAAVGESTARYDLLLVLLGVALVVAAVAYGLGLRRRPARQAADAGECGDAACKAEGLARLLGRRAGRAANRLVFVVIGLVVLFMIAILGYVLYATLLVGR